MISMLKVRKVSIWVKFQIIWGLNYFGIEKNFLFHSLLFYMLNLSTNAVLLLFCCSRFIFIDDQQDDVDDASHN